jgi:hypothetical protein
MMIGWGNGQRSKLHDDWLWEMDSDRSCMMIGWFGEMGDLERSKDDWLGEMDGDRSCMMIGCFGEMGEITNTPDHQSERLGRKYKLEKGLAQTPGYAGNGFCRLSVAYN